MGKLSTVSARCANSMLECLKNEPGRDYSFLRQSLKTLGFGDTAIRNAKNHLLDSSQIARIGKGVNQYRWYLFSETPSSLPGQIDKNRESLESLYASLPCYLENSSKCFIYFFMRDGDGIVKIGATEDIRRRAKEVTYACGSTVQLILYASYENRKAATEQESILHSIFERFNLFGEWFNIPGDNKEAIADFIKEWIRNEK
jgi:predicted GIY-YIG superfamily endonuclease